MRPVWLKVLLFATPVILVGGGVGAYTVFKSGSSTSNNQVEVSEPTIETGETTDADEAIASSTEALLESAKPSLTPKPTPKPSPSPTPSPSPDPVLLQECQSASKPYDYFNGATCWPDTEQHRLYNAMQGNKDRDDINRMLLSGNQGDIESRLLNSCLKVSKERHEKCSESLRINSGRIQNEFLSSHPNEPSSCLAKYPGSDTGLIRDLYWRQRMEESIEGIYAFCHANGDSLDNFHL